MNNFYKKIISCLLIINNAYAAILTVKNDLNGDIAVAILYHDTWHEVIINRKKDHTFNSGFYDIQRIRWSSKTGIYKAPRYRERPIYTIWDIPLKIHALSLGNSFVIRPGSSQETSLFDSTQLGNNQETRPENIWDRRYDIFTNLTTRINNL